MKKILSVFVLVGCMATASFASFPVQKSAPAAEATTEVVAESKVTETVAEVADAKEMRKAMRAEAKLAKKEIKAMAKEARKNGDDNTIALILALVSVFFLPFGLHNWYLGRTKQAIWQTVLTLLIITFPISWIWQLVDFFRLLGGGLPS